jgi:hypothetical protein
MIEQTPTRNNRSLVVWAPISIELPIFGDKANEVQRIRILSGNALAWRGHSVTWAAARLLTGRNSAGSRSRCRGYSTAKEGRRFLKGSYAQSTGGRILPKSGSFLDNRNHPIEYPSLDLFQGRSLA